jgi:hypothetical protein
MKIFWGYCGIRFSCWVGLVYYVVVEAGYLQNICTISEASFGLGHKFKKVLLRVCFTRRTDRDYQIFVDSVKDCCLWKMDFMMQALNSLHTLDAFSSLNVVDSSSTNFGSILFIGGVLISYGCMMVTPTHRWLPGVPIYESTNSKEDQLASRPFFGLTRFNHHKLQRKIFTQHGPLVQFHVAGRRMLLISDKTIARQALRDIHGKGYPFHNPTPKLVCCC